MLPMVVAPEAFVGCTHRSTGSEKHVEFFSLLLSSRYLETSDVSGDDQPLEANFLTVADLIGPVVGPNVALFPPRLARSW